MIVQESLLIKLDIARVEPEYPVKTKIRLSILADKSLILSISLRNTILLCVFLEDNARIVTTESKCIGQGNINFAFLCFIEREIKVRVDVSSLSPSSWLIVGGQCRS